MKFILFAAVTTLLTAPPVFASQLPMPASTGLGEQLIYQAPENWELAFAEDREEAGYLLEFIPKGDEINSWQQGYLSVQKNPMPSKEILDQIRERNLHPATVALAQYQQAAARSCPGTFDSMAQGDNTFNGTYVSVTGGFCDQYGETAPHGEGAVIAVLEGKSSFFLVKYAWRPKDENENRDHRWRITPESITNYLTSIKQMSVCIPDSDHPCPN
jgi:hypothetical protein